MARVQLDPVTPPAASQTRTMVVAFVLALILGVGLTSFYFLALRPAAGPRVSDSITSGQWQDLVSNVDKKTRAQVFRQSLEKGAALGNWPATPQAVIADFWGAASQKDYASMALLCPGSLESDFKHYYEHWTPSAAKAVGEGAPHASEPQVFVFPAKVDFPFFDDKTIKMAMTRLKDGRWIIDGQHTIWW